MVSAVEQQNNNYTVYRYSYCSKVKTKNRSKRQTKAGNQEFQNLNVIEYLKNLSMSHIACHMSHAKCLC